MARPTAAPSLDAPISLTTGAIERLVCPAGKQQAFLRDTQVPGLKVRATAEKHYTVRPLDLLRVHHERIEAWILEQGGVVFAKSNNRLSVVGT